MIEILTLSSDDEDGGENAKDSIVDERIISKEPVITPDMDTIANAPDDSLNQFLDGTYSGPHTFLQCRSIRIGSYKVIPSKHVGFSEKGLYISLPTLDDGNILLFFSLLFIINSKHFFF